MAGKRDTSKKPGRRPGKSQDLIPKGYHELLTQLKERIRTAQLRAALAVNRELIELYWQIGQSIVEHKRPKAGESPSSRDWPDDLQAEFPGTADSRPGTSGECGRFTWLNRGGPKTSHDPWTNWTV